MVRTIRIVSTENVDSPSSCSSQATPGVTVQKLAAGIDTDIFESDSLELGGERFWESYWKTLHVYGGVSPGQALASVFGALPEQVFDKLYRDAEQLCADPSAMSEADRDDVFGMVVFLLGIEGGDPKHGSDVLAVRGYEATLAYFVEAVQAERRRRDG